MGRGGGRRGGEGGGVSGTMGRGMGGGGVTDYVYVWAIKGHTFARLPIKLARV